MVERAIDHVHGVYGLGIWTECSRDSLSLLHCIWGHEGWGLEFIHADIWQLMPAVGWSLRLSPLQLSHVPPLGELVWASSQHGGQVLRASPPREGARRKFCLL